jgi:MFS family permease
MIDQPSRRMRGLLVFLIALLTSVAGCVLGLFAGDYLTQLYHVSNMEGQRGYMIVFLCAPLGMVAGFVVGLVVALRLRNRRSGFIGFISAQGLAVLAACVLAGIVTGLLFLAADKPPTIDGRRLTLDFELRVPPAVQLPGEFTDSTVHASLYAKGRENRLAELELKSIRNRDGFIIIPGTVALTSHSATRELFASVGNAPNGSQFIKLRLPASPKKEHQSWSDWIDATEYAGLSPVPEPERISARYRVRPLDE